MIESKIHKDNQILPVSEQRTPKKWPKVVAGVALLGASVVGANKGMDTAPRPSLGEIEKVEVAIAPNEALTIEDVTKITKQSIEEIQAGKVGVFIPINYNKRAVFHDKLDSSKSFRISRPITMSKQSDTATNKPNDSYYGAVIDGSNNIQFFDPNDPAYEFSIEDAQNDGPDTNFQQVVLRLEDKLLNGLFIDESTGLDARLPLARYSS